MGYIGFWGEELGGYDGVVEVGGGWGGEMYIA